jgi:hypothetical protein
MPRLRRAATDVGCHPPNSLHRAPNFDSGDGALEPERARTRVANGFCDDLGG